MYIGVLEDGLVDVHKEVYDNLGNPFFQQDNANIRTAKDTMAWFEAQHSDHDMAPQLADINPIEHVWKWLKERMHKRFPEIHKTPGGPARVRRALAEALSDTWREEIEGDFLETLWESMPRRVAALLEAKGWYTKY